ncbi:CoA transferase [Alphaproteobacteria bacterium]|nr:CoA transferase [Alphaproteobacteria bacterium]
MSQATAQYPLKGIQVLELSSMITCSLAAMTMRAQGASVIKVEPLGIGDAMRKVGTQKGGISTLFYNCNRGKRSLAIDLKSDAGQEAMLELAKNADVILHNYRPGVMDRLGFGSQALRTLNKKLIYIGVSGFGSVGPMAKKPAYDHVIQGLSGLTDLQGEGDNYSYVRSLICDKVTAYTVAQAATAALLARASTGQGQHIEISMLHACLAFLWPDMMMNHTMPDGAEGAMVMPPMSDYYQVLSLKDGSITMAPLHDHHWHALLPMLGYAELLDDARFNCMAGRAANMDQAMGLLRHPKTDLSVAEAIEILEAADVPCTICERRETLSENDQVNAIGALETYVTQNLGQITVPTPPVLFDGQATSLAQDSPSLGQHSAEILQELGFDADRIETLVQQGIVGCA